MRARKRLFWAALATAIVVAVAGGIWWWTAHQPPPQIITLPSGAQYRFAGVTYGTNNVPPSLLAKMAHWLPAPLAMRVRKYAGDRISMVNEGEVFDLPHLFVWLKRVGTNAPGGTRTIPQGFMPTAVLANEAGVLAGEQTYEYFQDNATWVFMSFGVVPKRSKELECRLYGGPYGAAAYAEFGKIRFANPLYGRYAKWEPEPVPTVKKSGDLEVRLDSVSSGNPQSGATLLRPNGSRAPGLAPITGGGLIGTEIDYSVRSAEGTNERWVLQNTGLTDATGNRLGEQGGSTSLGDWNNKPWDHADWHGYSEVIDGALWPDEPAWRLKLEFKRSFGFAPGELVTFSNVPVPAPGATNFLRMTNIAGGMPVVLDRFVRRGDIANNMIMDVIGDWATEIHVELRGRPKDVALDFLDMTTDTGKPVTYGSSMRNSAYVLLFRSIPTNSQTADITFVLQKTRTVEFTVKPRGINFNFSVK